MVKGLKNAYLTHFSSLLSWFNCPLKILIFSPCMWKMWMRFSIRIRIRIFRICAYSAYFAYFAYAWPTLVLIPSFSSRPVSYKYTGSLPGQRKPRSSIFTSRVSLISFSTNRVSIFRPAGSKGSLAWSFSDGVAIINSLWS